MKTTSLLLLSMYLLTVQSVDCLQTSCRLWSWEQFWRGSSLLYHRSGLTTLLEMRPVLRTLCCWCPGHRGGWDQWWSCCISWPHNNYQWVSSRLVSGHLYKLDKLKPWVDVEKMSLQSAPIRRAGRLSERWDTRSQDNISVSPTSSGPDTASRLSWPTWVSGGLDWWVRDLWPRTWSSTIRIVKYVNTLLSPLPPFLISSWSRRSLVSRMSWRWLFVITNDCC